MPLLQDLAGAPELSTLFTTLAVPTAPNHAAVCAVIEALLLYGEAAETAAVFNTHFGTHSPSLYLAYDEHQPKGRRMVGLNAYQHAGAALYWLLTGGHATRVKRCADPRCQQLFFDTTKPENKAYCSPHRRVRTRQRKRLERDRHRLTAPGAPQTPC